ncbi:glycosyltransferase family 9 protein [Roseiterribacter gracilis]|uniref:Glycosyl transferase n=1 Tax=Roseiterribacter gracilis TaxID=2812848 RepID=A0A8S8XDT5_9PROT|nr:glycosyl transferase [Rhodospirillales bacterium TMPK1]
MSRIAPIGHRAPTARILVIRLSAFGDIVLAFPAFQAIRRHHPDAHITFLTTAPFAALAKRAPWFDEVWIDDRPRWRDPLGWLRLRRRLREGRFNRVYDLQTQGRTNLYFRLFWPGPVPEWSGIAPGASHPHRDPKRTTLHASDLYAGQLRDAGIAQVPPADLGWLDADLARFELPPRFALLVPGAAAHRPEKRWPAERYGEAAVALAAQGLVPVILGGASEVEAARVICAACPGARDLTTRTDLFEIGALARRAVLAIGNDTGPMHLIAAAGCPSIVLFSHASDPARAAPRGAAVTILRVQDLRGLSTEAVLKARPGDGTAGANTTSE